VKAKQFRFEADKFSAAGLTALASDVVKPARARECPVQMDGIPYTSGSFVRQVGSVARRLVHLALPRAPVAVARTMHQVEG